MSVSIHEPESQLAGTHSPLCSDCSCSASASRASSMAVERPSRPSMGTGGGDRQRQREGARTKHSVPLLTDMHTYRL